MEHLVKAFPCLIKCIRMYSSAKVANRFTTRRDRRPLPAAPAAIWHPVQGNPPIHQGMTTKWSAVTGMATRGSMPSISSIPLKTLQNSLNYATAGITTASPCVPLGEKRPSEY